jgi:hypothetical protein
MEDQSASQQIDNIIKLHSGWKGETLSQLRTVINGVNPDIFEEVKWKMRTRPEGLSVWSLNGIICFAEIWKDNIKLLFPKGVNFKDPKKLFNSRLESKDIRAIELKEGDSIDETALKELVAEAVAFNTSLKK